MTSKRGVCFVESAGEGNDPSPALSSRIHPRFGVTHPTFIVGTGPFDNRSFRQSEGDVLPFGPDATITVTARTNIGNDFSSRFVLRDSMQDATRRNEPTCTNTIANRFGQPVSCASAAPSRASTC